MNEQFVRFGTVTPTNVSGAVLAFVALVCLLIFLVPRRWIIAPLFFAWFLVPLGQRLVIAGLNFMMFRIVILAAILRAILQVFSGGSDSRFRWNRIDTAVLLWGLSSAVTFTLLYGQWAAFVNRLGLLYNAFGVYFTLRVFYRDEEDIDRTVKVLAVLCAVVAACMSVEHFTGRNFFGTFGGVPEWSAIRDGKIRSQGPFAHSILAGTFGATLLPLFLGLWWQKSRAKFMALLGTVSALVIAVASVSATPLMALFAGVGALCLWPFRQRMRLFRWAVALALIGLHLVMKAPVWALIGRLEVVGGSSGYHRYRLVDEFISRFWEWWLVGTRETASWGYDMWDTANQYVDTGVSGGLITFVLFLGIIVCCFKGLGRARKAVQGNVTAERRLWTMNAALVATLVAFFGITYFDQTALSWYASLAMFSSLSAIYLRQPLHESEFAGTSQVRNPRLAGLRTVPNPVRAGVPAGNPFLSRGARPLEPRLSR